MSACCQICFDFTEDLYALPCDIQHSACRSCLLRNQQPLCQAIKCHQCRKVSVWVDIDDLAIVDHERKEVECNLCDPSSAGKAKNFCSRCKEAFCADCAKAHDLLYENDVVHLMVPCNDIAKRNELALQYCNKPGHNEKLIDSACRLCGEPACRMCRQEITECDESSKTQHEYTPVQLQCATLIKQLQIHGDELKAKSFEVDDRLKILMNSMEQFRLSTGTAVENLTSTRGRYSQIGISRSALKVTSLLEERAEEVNSLRSGYDKALVKLTDHQECLAAVMESSNPVILLRERKRILTSIKGLLSVEFHEVDLKPILVQEPAGHFYEDTPLILNGNTPTAIRYVKTIPVAVSQQSATVCLLNDGTIIHGGPTYNSLGIVGTTFQRVIYDEASKAIVYTDSTHKQLTGYDLETKAVKYSMGCNWSPRSVSFTKNGRYIYLGTRAHRSIHVYDSLNKGLSSVLSFDDVYFPRHLCSGLDGQVYVTSDGALSSFNADDLEPEARRVANAGADIESLAWHNYHVFVPGWRSLSVFDLHGFLKFGIEGLMDGYQVKSNPLKTVAMSIMIGERVCDFQLTGVNGHPEDISINKRGEVAIADGPEGVHLYQLVYG